MTEFPSLQELCALKLSVDDIKSAPQHIQDICYPLRNMHYPYYTIMTQNLNKRVTITYDYVEEGRNRTTENIIYRKHVKETRVYEVPSAKIMHWGQLVETRNLKRIQ